MDKWNTLLPSKNFIALTILNDLRDASSLQRRPIDHYYYNGERTICLLTRGPRLPYGMGCYLKGLVRLFLLEYPPSEAKMNSLFSLGSA
ncbi:hypothetical protein RDI58_025444 [Solanum bulbocastanum]|uniref:Uncharacterized protein n=1 Tax=Solanum bulbocastanum TaxID=147425 RepID=A0AAN8T527_SOLBU